MNTDSEIKSRLITDDQLYELIRPGDRIFFSSGPVTPVATIRNMINASHKNLEDLEFIQITPPHALFPGSLDTMGRFRVKTFFAGENISKTIASGSFDFIPTTLAELPYLFASGAVELDCAIVQTSPPDRRGNVSLGPANDVTELALYTTPIVVAEINPNVPRTHGQTVLSIKFFDYVIERDVPLLTLESRPFDDVMNAIGRHVSHIIEDGSTLSMGAGRIFDAIAANLKDKKDLRVCSHVVSDWIMGLIDSGATARKSAFNRKGPVSATACMGSEGLYRYIAGNPDIAILPLLNSSYQNGLPRIPRLVSIINANGIDVSGDSVSLSGNEFLYGGFDAKLNMSSAAVNSRDGKSIVVLKSIDRWHRSNIVISHNGPMGKIRSALGTTRYVVTEYGTANIFGKSIRDRTIAMIDIAHPMHRERLLREAKEAGFVHPEQVYNVDHATRYPDGMAHVKRFGKGVDVLFRPIKPSDVSLMRRLFYNISENSVFMRYLATIRVMPYREMQHYVNIDYDGTLSFVGIIQTRGVERIIAECRYAYYDACRTHEIAFIVDEDYHGLGLGTYMVRYIMETAAARNIPKLTAYVHKDNARMSWLFEHAPVTPDITPGEFEKEYTFYLNMDVALNDDLKSY